MLLIMSAAYITQELRSEFGPLPPCFLPLGNRRLFHHQLNIIPKNLTTWITLPESFLIPESDEDYLKKRCVNIMPIPDDLSLGTSLVTALNLIEADLTKELHILFGDTLLTDLPEGKDIVATASIDDNYNWAVINENATPWISEKSDITLQQSQNVVAGYFRISNPKELVRCIIKEKWNFIEGLNKYKITQGLTAVKVREWFDFGHANTYYHSKSAHTTQRAFNNLKVEKEWVEKSGGYGIKIASEAFWFENIPAMLRRFTPQYLGKYGEKESTIYRLEYLHHSALNELWVFSKNPGTIWNKILKECINFIKSCQENIHNSEAEDKESFAYLFDIKTNERIKTFLEDSRITADRIFHFREKAGDLPHSASITQIITDSTHNLPKKNITSTVMHGDFCFSNILYEHRTNRIRAIDPRGMTNSKTMSIYGDYRYDIAKLSHSVLGMYDWIIAGYQQCKIDENNILLELPKPKEVTETQTIFIEMIEKEFGITSKELYAMQIQLFLSMLPLHNDDKNRQDGLLANCFRLHRIMQELKT